MWQITGLIGAHNTHLGAEVDSIWRTSASGAQLAAILPGVYLQDEWFIQRVTIHSGLRYDRASLSVADDATTRQGWSPRAGVVYTPWRSTALRMTAGRFSRFGRLAATAPWSVDTAPLEADTVPLRADVALLGVEQQLWYNTMLRGYVSRRVPADATHIAFRDDRADLLFEQHLQRRWEAYVGTAYTVTTDDASRISVACSGEGAVTDRRLLSQAVATWDTPTDPWTTRLGGRIAYNSGRCGEVAESDWSAGVLLQQRIPIRNKSLFATIEVNDIGTMESVGPTWSAGARFEHY